jgi:uncharacterized protein (DUF2147 family)
VIGFVFDHTTLQANFMKHLFLIFFSILTFNCFAQDGSDLIIGKWLKTSKQDLIIEVYRSGDEYKGRISWTKNIDSAKHVGFQILEGLTYNPEKQEWTNGKIRDPKSGNTYSAIAKIMTDGTLEVLAYKGFRFIGKKKYFKRV